MQVDCQCEQSGTMSLQSEYLKNKSNASALSARARNFPGLVATVRLPAHLKLLVVNQQWRAGHVFAHGVFVTADKIMVDDL
jgi:hypothetical protein